MVERLFLTVPRGCLQFVIVVFPDHTHLLFFSPIEGAETCTNFWAGIYEGVWVSHTYAIHIYPCVLQ